MNSEQLCSALVPRTLLKTILRFAHLALGPGSRSAALLTRDTRIIVVAA